MNRGVARTAAILAAAALMAGGGAWGQGRRADRHRRGAPVACVPGAQVACACRGGGDGVQVCDDSGSRLLPCDCDGARATEGPAPTPEPPAAIPTAATSLGVGEGPATPWARRAALSAPPSARWYGWQVLLCDVAAEGFGVAALMSGSAILLAPSGAIHALGGPIVHWGHGNVGRGFASLGLRLALPTAGALIGVAAGSGTAAIVGGGVGSLVAIVLDIAVLARDSRPAAAPEARAPGVFASVTPQGVALGVGGSF